MLRGSFDKLRTNGRSGRWFDRLTMNGTFTPIPAFPHQGGRGGVQGRAFGRFRTNGRSGRWFGRFTMNEIFTPIPAFPHQGGRGFCPHLQGEGVIGQGPC